MRLKLFRHLWGLEQPWEQAFEQIRAQGYAGIETLLPAPADESRFTDLLTKHELEFIVTVHTRGSSVREDLASLRQQSERAARLNGRFVAAQAGSDDFDASDAAEFYAEALKIEAGVGIAIAHETHRGRPLFHPRATARIIERFPALKLVCDFSHWVCVCERLIDDALPVIHRVAEQAHHIHARVGYAQGPQVPDPRVERYRAEVEAHERWWNIVWDSQRRRGMPESTMCPEFGPPPYQQTEPSSGEPLADLAQIVEWQHDRQRRRFAERFGSRSSSS